VASLEALRHLLKHASEDTEVVVVDADLVEGGWIEELPAQLTDSAGWEEAAAAYVQLMEGFQQFAEPFEDFLRRAAELGTIPDADIVFEVWVFKCIRLCLTHSGLIKMVDIRQCACRELYEGALCSKAVAKVLLRGYKGRASRFPPA
jgi:hypothetical protein